MGSDAIARLRKAADNQAALGETEFHMPIMDMCRLVQKASEEARGGLPVDADGAPIHLNFKDLYRADGTKVEVDCYMRDPSDGEWRVLDTTGAMARASELYVQRPEADSWELLEDDLWGILEGGMYGYLDKRGIDYCTGKFTVERIAELHREVCADVVARAKRLAGADE